MLILEMERSQISNMRDRERETERQRDRQGDLEE